MFITSYQFPGERNFTQKWRKNIPKKSLLGKFWSKLKQYSEKPSKIQQLKEDVEEIEKTEKRLGKAFNFDDPISGIQSHFLKSCKESIVVALPWTLLAFLLSIIAIWVPIIKEYFAPIPKEYRSFSLGIKFFSIDLIFGAIIDYFLIILGMFAPSLAKDSAPHGKPSGYMILS